MAKSYEYKFVYYHHFQYILRVTFQSQFDLLVNFKFNGLKILIGFICIVTDNNHHQ